MHACLSERRSFATRLPNFPPHCFRLGGSVRLRAAMDEYEDIEDKNYELLARERELRHLHDLHSRVSYRRIVCRRVR